MESIQKSNKQLLCFKQLTKGFGESILKKEEQITNIIFVGKRAEQFEKERRYQGEDE